ncbi:hypothetical protein GCM10027447_12540 [Glycomyces halotolerans]
MTSNLVNGMSHGEGSSDYGDLFWKIGLPDGRQASVHADSLEVDDSGALHSISHSRNPEHQEKFPGLILAAGQWEYAYAASAIDGSAVAVDYVDEDRAES